MKKWIMALVCLMTMVISANAQKSSVYSQKSNDFSLYAEKNITNDDMYHITKEEAASIELAGKYLKKSATFDALSLGFFAIGGAGVAVAASLDADEEYYKLAGVFGVASIVCQIAKIQYKWKSGKTLELYGNGVRLTF